MLLLSRLAPPLVDGADFAAPYPTDSIVFRFLRTSLNAEKEKKILFSPEKQNAVDSQHCAM